MHALTWQRQFLRLQNLTEKWQTLCTSKPFFQKGCPIIGKISVLVKYKEFHRVLPLLVVKGAGPNLFGRDWLSQINVNMGKIFSLEPPSVPLKEIIEEYPNVFSDQLGCLNGAKVHLYVGLLQQNKVVPPFPN